MDKFKRLLMPLLAIVIFAASAFGEQAAEKKRETVPLKTTQKMRKETQFLVFAMERGHYLKTPVTDLDVREFIREYMQSIDFFKLFFTLEDVQEFQDFFAPSIDIMLRQGTLLPAFSIYEKFLERAEARINWMEKRMEQPFNFEGDETFAPDRSKSDWPQNLAAADEMWEKRIKFDLINQILGKSNESELAQEGVEESLAPEMPTVQDVVSEAEEGVDIGPAMDAAMQSEESAAQEQREDSKTFDEKLAEAEKEVLKRYKRLVEQYAKADSMEIQEIYLNALSHLYDPHSAFLSEYYLEEFDISVRNSLVGIGALLQDKDGYCTIAEIMPGGPAEEGKQLKPGDKILAVGQETGEMVDVIGTKLRKTVRLIRGKADTKVRLLIEPSSDPAGRRIITLVRKEVKLTTKLAKAEVFTVPVGDKTIPIGVIDLPAFYGEGGGADGSTGFSTSKDVEELLLKLKDMGVQGVILDLRRNGGGFLNEAVDLAGLFIETGPVVQVRDAAGKINYLRDENSKLVWDGPLMILVSRLSASATEIVAGALKNHERAIIVGDKRTHGKGTVQAVYHLTNFDSDLKSAAKVTVQKWYAPNGDSIQVEGVHPDIVLPSAYDYMEIGEEYKDYAMKWDRISADSIESLWGYGLPEGEADALMNELTAQSIRRQQDLDEFKVWNDRIDWVKTRQQKKDWSLNFADRESQLKEDESFNELMKRRIKELSSVGFEKTEILLNSAKANEHLAEDGASENKSEKRHDALEIDPEGEEAPDFDIQLREALRIMADWLNVLYDPSQLKKGPDAPNSPDKEADSAIAQKS